VDQQFVESTVDDPRAQVDFTELPEPVLGRLRGVEHQFDAIDLVLPERVVGLHRRQVVLRQRPRGARHHQVPAPAGAVLDDQAGVDCGGGRDIRFGVRRRAEVGAVHRLRHRLALGIPARGLQRL